MIRDSCSESYTLNVFIWGLLIIFHVFHVYLSQLALLLEEKKYMRKHAFPTTSCNIIIQDQTYLNCTHKEHN